MMRHLLVSFVLSVICCYSVAQMLDSSYVIDLSKRPQMTDYHIQLRKYKPKYKWVYDIIETVDSIHPKNLDVYILRFSETPQYSICIPEKLAFYEIFINPQSDEYIGYWKYDDRIIILIGKKSKLFFKKKIFSKKYKLYSNEYPEEIDYNWPTFFIINNKAINPLTKLQR